MIVAKQPLEGGQVRPSFEQVSRVAVAEGVTGDWLAQPGRSPCGDDGPLERGHMERLSRWAGEEPVGRPVVEPVRSEVGQEFVGQRHATVLCPFAVTDPQDMASRVDIANPEVVDLADPQPAAVSEPEHESVTTGWDGIQEASDLAGCEHDREGLGHPGEGNERDELGSVEDDSVEEPEGTGDLIEQAPGHRLGDQMELKIAELVPSETVRSAPEMLGRSGHRGDVSLDRALGVIATCQFVNESLT